MRGLRRLHHYLLRESRRQISTGRADNPQGPPEVGKHGNRASIQYFSTTGHLSRSTSDINFLKTLMASIESIPTLTPVKNGKSECPLLKAPGPRPLPVVGNIFDLDLKEPYTSALEIAKKYGDIFQMTYVGKREINVCTHALAHEVCDETRFHKLVASGVSTLRQVVDDALFTALHGSRQWGITHRILKPIFGPIKIREMFDDMKDVAEQLCLKWARDGPHVAIDPAFDYTRLTLDTIAICLMDYRFNSFYRGGTHHPFVKHMVDILAEADIQSMLPGWAGVFRMPAMRKFKRDIKLMHELCRGMVEFRRQNPVETNDFLNAMLHTQDPETGERLSDDEVVRNLITFLVAGHETTSGLLCFATFYLLEHPESLRKLQQEVDDVCGGESITAKHIQKMPYMDAVLREALRLMPTAVAFYVTPYKDELIGGKYLVHPGEAICLLLDRIHRDKEVWGQNAEEWEPERMMQDKFDKLPPNCWKPFGNGARICLGMAFSWQESKLALAMILQNFDLSKDDPSYKLKIKHLLTIKPEGFKIRAKLRQGRNATAFHRSLRAEKEQNSSNVTKLKKQASPTGPGAQEGRPIRILYGSETGTCEAVAQHLASESSMLGFSPTVQVMNDAATKSLLQSAPVVFVLGSYHGTSATNASKFMRWLEEASPMAMTGIEYAVYGVGHSDWTQTFYQMPVALDKKLEELGATRMCPMGRVNTANDDIFTTLEAWLNDCLWETLGVDMNVQPEFPKNETDVEIIVGDTPRDGGGRKGFTRATVTEALPLSAPGVAQKIHIEFRLTEGVNYQAGDHLQVLPMNDRSTVRRVLSRFQLEEHTPITIWSQRPLQSLNGIPVNTPLTAGDLFSSYVDLHRAATARNVDTLIDAATDEHARQELRETLASISTNTASVLDIMERLPTSSLTVSIKSFLAMLPAILPRTYSFSSAPGWRSGHGTLTVNVVDRAQAGANRGLASNYLSSLVPGDSILISVPEPTPERHSFFSLPEKTVPVVMICAGTGLAPFRGFVQERALYLRNNPNHKDDLAPAVLFFGCRGQELDDMYRDELDAFQEEGVVTVRRAYSRDQSGNGGCRYVTDKVRLFSDEVVELWNRGGNIYVCGTKRMSDDVFGVLGPLLAKADQILDGEANSKESVEIWKKTLAANRYVVEIFS